MVPLEAMALADGLEEEEVVLEDDGAPVEAGRVALPVGTDLTVTVVMVVLEKWTVEVARAGLPVIVAFCPEVVAGAVPSGADVRLTPVACATPATVLFAKSGNELLLPDGARVA